MSEQYSYDHVPYPSYTFPKTFPDRLATMASLYGVQAADPAECKLLELGCGDGTNLLAMAYSMPESAFTGIDLSQFHIDKAMRSGEWIGASNVNFVQDDITELDPERLGKFDYIVAHGLFSWVPESVRSSILNIYSKCLASNGVGYISYNVFPGGHIRRMLWDMMRFHADNEADPSVKVQTARAIAAFVADSACADTPYKDVLQKEVEALATREDQGVFHDDLGAINRPFYFHEFVEQLEQNGLRYLADADPEPAIERGLSPEALTSLETLSNGDRIKREQMIDFIRGQRFRCSLFCRDDVSPLDEASIDAIDNLMATTRLDDDRNSNPVSVKFTGPENQAIELNHPLTIAMLKYLRSEWPRAVPFRDALEAVSVRDTVWTDDDVERCRTYLLDLFDVELVDLHLFQASFVREISAKPEVSRFARYQAETGCRVVTTMPGSNIEISNEPLRVLISILDGSKGREELIDGMVDRLKVPDAELSELREQLPQMIEGNLKKMCELGLLVG